MEIDLPDIAGGSQTLYYASNLREGIRIAEYLIREYGPDAYRYAKGYARAALKSLLKKRDRKGDPVKKLKQAFDEVSNMNDAVNFRRVKTVIGSTRKRTANELFKKSIGEGTEFVFRWQACSKNLIGPGFRPIGYGGLTSAEVNVGSTMPCVVMSLTTCPIGDGDNVMDSNASIGCIDQGLCKIVYFEPGTPAVSGHFGWQSYESQNYEGTLKTDAKWELEKGPAGLSPLYRLTSSKIFHKYTDIRLNLYGSKLYPLDYNVYIVKVKGAEMIPFVYAETQGYAGIPPPADFPIAKGSKLNNFLRDLNRPIILNPLVGGNAPDEYKDDITIMKHKKYHVPAFAYGDAAAIGAGAVQSTNIVNANVFLRHDRHREYGWNPNIDSVTFNDEMNDVGWTKTNVNSGDARCWKDLDFDERVFMYITCSCPKRLEGTNYNPESAPPLTQAVLPGNPAFDVEGSYDIVVRNCFVAPLDYVT